MLNQNDTNTTLADSMSRFNVWNGLWCMHCVVGLITSEDWVFGADRGANEYRT